MTIVLMPEFNLLFESRPAPKLCRELVKLPTLLMLLLPPLLLLPLFVCILLPDNGIGRTMPPLSDGWVWTSPCVAEKKCESNSGAGVTATCDCHQDAAVD